jgi:hypothetical protein
MFGVCAVVDRTFNLEKICWYEYGCVLGSQAYRGISFFTYGYLNFTRSAFLYFSLSLCPPIQEDLEMQYFRFN